MYNIRDEEIVSDECDTSSFWLKIVFIIRATSTKNDCVVIYVYTIYSFVMRFLYACSVSFIFNYVIYSDTYIFLRAKRIGL